MKLNFTQLSLAGVLMAFLSFQSLPSQAAGSVRKPIEKVDEEKTSRKKSKAHQSRNNHAVRIYPDKMKKLMHVVAKDNGKEIDFFVFDLQGTLMEHKKMEAGEHEKLNELQKGKYVYRVFSGDEETASGTFEMR